MTDSTFRLFYVFWIDSVHATGWLTKAKMPDPALVHSIGWLIDEKDDAIWLAPHYIPEREGVPEQLNGAMVIPRAAILQMRQTASPLSVDKPDYTSAYASQDDETDPLSKLEKV